MFCRLFYAIKNKTNKEALMVGIEIIAPYLINPTKENLTSYFINKAENIMPAKAPRGVKKAPRLLPIIVAYVA